MGLGELSDGSHQIYYGLLDSGACYMQPEALRQQRLRRLAWASAKRLGVGGVEEVVDGLVVNLHESRARAK